MKPFETDPDPKLAEVEFELDEAAIAAFEPCRVQVYKSAATPERARVSLLWPDQGMHPEAMEVKLSCSITTTTLVTRKDDGWMFALSMFLDVPLFKFSHYVGPRAAVRIAELWYGQIGFVQTTPVAMRHAPIDGIRTTFLHWPVSAEQIAKYRLNG